MNKRKFKIFCALKNFHKRVKNYNLILIIFASLPIALVRGILLIPFFRKISFKIVVDPILAKKKKFPIKVQQDTYYMLIAFYNMIKKNIFEITDKHSRKKRLDIFLNIFFQRIRSASIIGEFKKKYGQSPPGFLTVGIGKFCNLKCKGCYASSDCGSSEKLSWEIMDWILTEKKKLWQSVFTVISGGEPLLWTSDGKNLLDLAEKHNDQLFMFYTNGKLIDDKMISRMNKLGNISPSISLEGYEKDTDDRRGAGTYKRILDVMKKLKESNLPFGFSITVNNENAELLFTEDIFDFYFKECGASYGWIFQYMPIGREMTLNSLVTAEQRLNILKNVQLLVKDKGYFIADFWGSGSCVSGCISAGRYGGYFYIDWNGNITPCNFNPYSSMNIYDIYKQGKNLNDLLMDPFFKGIREWQKKYVGEEKNGNLMTPCMIKDHYKDLRPLIDKFKPIPIDDSAREALVDDMYKDGLIRHGLDLKKTFDPEWEKVLKKSR
ncbi:MAG: radical SAM protein [Lentisphaerota bacterium]